MYRLRECAAHTLFIKLCSQFHTPHPAPIRKFLTINTATRISINHTFNAKSAHGIEWLPGQGYTQQYKLFTWSRHGEDAGPRSIPWGEFN